MKIVLAGECMMARPWSRYGHPGFARVMDRMRAGDVTYAHLETVIGSTAELEGPKSADWTGSYLIAPPSVADELAWAGVDLVSAASNHSFDFGTSGTAPPVPIAKQPAWLAPASASISKRHALPFTPRRPMGAWHWSH